MTDKKTVAPSTSFNRRRTLGYLTPNISDNVGLARWRGVVDAAREQDANLICFPGAIWRTPQPEGQANVIYNLINPENPDGLILGNIIREDLIDPDEIRAFYERYHQIPCVSIRETVNGIPHIPLDNYQGMREAMIHLIEEHGYRRIAFLSGPADHPYAVERYRAYCDTLKEYDLPLDPTLVTPPSSWNTPGIQILLDERQLVPPAAFDAVMAVNDRKALDALHAFHARGIQVPEDVAVVGFNNDMESTVVTPPLTSVAMPFYEQGQQAVIQLLAQLDEIEIPQVSLPARLVIRQSCGCTAPVVAQAAVGPIEISNDTLKNGSAKKREEILARMSQAVGIADAVALVSRLLDAFISEIDEDSSGAFLSALQDVLRRVGTRNGRIDRWHRALSVLRRELLPYLADNKRLARAEDLWQQGRVTIGEAVRRAQNLQILETEQQSQILLQIGQRLITSFDVAQLSQVLAEDLPRLEIPGCYLSLYEKPEQSTEWSRLVLGYDNFKRVEPDAKGQHFRSSELIPNNLLPQTWTDRSYSLVVEPLYFQENQLGFVIFEIGPHEGQVYDTLRGEISSALQGAILIEQTERRAFLIQTADEVSQVANSILDPRELTQSVVDLVRDRFDLYHVGLFLLEMVDAQIGGPSQWAVLRAATGVAGKKLLAKGYRLKVTSDSLVCQCITKNKPCIALDITGEKNPLLPDARSELALPLISRGEAIGALNVQSTQEDAFTEEEVTILQMMVSQLSTALENARLFQQLEEELDEVKSSLRRYVRQSWSKF